MSLAGKWVSQAIFGSIHSSQLIYNTCWEDPRLDRQALKIKKSDNILMITSAGCNALDYALDNPNHIYAVDLNPRQNALLDLKIAGIRNLDFETFFQIFGKGRLENFAQVYRYQLRSEIPESSRRFWDRNTDYFNAAAWRPSFYYRGTSGFIARITSHYIHLNSLQFAMSEMFSAKTLEDQKKIYEREIQDRLFSKALNWLFSRENLFVFLGVPKSQYEQVEGQYKGGMLQFCRDSIEAICTKLPLSDNYFWWLYLQGGYSLNRCPEYLKQENFKKLQAGLVDKITTHTSSLHEFMQKSDQPISKFVLLDHMDWLAASQNRVLQAEWQGILKHAEKNPVKAIWRSASAKTDFVNRVPVKVQGRDRQVGDIVSYEEALAAGLHKQDRVHTYGSFSIANIDLH